MALVHRGGETITVTTIKSFTTGTYLRDANGQPMGVMVAKLQLRSGGMIFALPGTPVVGGGSGNHMYSIGDEWEVWGDDDLMVYKMISKAGEAAAVVDVQYEGESVGT